MSTPAPHTTIHFKTQNYLDGTTITDELNNGQIDQKRVTTDELISPTANGLTIHTFLGCGSFGAAYKCVFDGESYVIKLPVDLVRALCRGGILESLSGHSLREFVTHLRRANALPLFEQLKEGIEDLRRECMHAEAILEPPVYELRCALYRRRYPAHIVESSEINYKFAGQPIEGLRDKDEYRELVRRMRIHTAHPGHKHWHVINHADFNIPCIISEAANGSLSELMHQVVHNQISGIYFDEVDTRILPPLWLTIAKQVGLALEYMKTYSSKIHVDLKPANILFKYTGPGRVIHLYVSDYGLCLNDGVLNRENNAICGTGLYGPPRREFETWYRSGATAFDLTVHQYMITLIQCLVIKPYDAGEAISLSMHIEYIQRYEHYDQRIRLWISSMQYSFQPQHRLVWSAFKQIVFFASPVYLTNAFDLFLGAIQRNIATEEAVFKMGDVATSIQNDDAMELLSEEAQSHERIVRQQLREQQRIVDSEGILHLSSHL